MSLSRIEYIEHDLRILQVFKNRTETRLKPVAQTYVKQHDVYLMQLLNSIYFYHNNTQIKYPMER